jgi:RNA polymerase sigma-70 factor (ECF subfamily)
MNSTMTHPEFERVYVEHKEQVWKLVSNYVASRHDREDLFQEVFLKIYRALPKFRGESSISTWIYRITVNTALNYLKKQKRYAAFKDLLSRFRLVDVEDKAEDQGREGIFKPLKKLNPQQRVILTLADVQEKKLEEIAQTLNIPLGTVKSSLHRAREIIKKELSKNDKL